MQDKQKKKTIYAKFFKRFFDISISFVAILILSPILLLLYIFNCIFVGFPTIFKQPRPGKNNKNFYIYKFRSMNNKRDKNGVLLPDSQRITTWGKIMRKTSLDELPQLFCILFGKMSIIGFRPRLVKDVIFYEKEVFDCYTETPGLTGPIQATSRNDNSWEGIFEADKKYNQNITLKEDIKIFFKTFISVFKHSGQSHDNLEEDKTQTRDYYYADYLRKTGKISIEQYDYGMALAREISISKANLEFHPEILETNLFDKMKEHIHALFVMKNKKGEILNYFDNDWNVLLLPNMKLDIKNTRTTIENYLCKKLGLSKSDFKINFLFNKIHDKFSQKDKVNKTYNHFFYEIKLKKCPTLFNNKEFKIKNTTFSWQSLAELKANTKVQEANCDIINFLSENKIIK